MAAPTVTIVDRSQVASLLKNVYEGELQEAIQNEVPFFKDATRVQMPLDGTDLIVGVHVGRNNAIQNTTVSGYLPAGASETVINGTLRAARTFGAFVMDNELLKLAKRDVAAFARGSDLVMEGVRATMTKDLERQALGDGTGVLATSTAGAASGQTAIVVDSTQFLEEGMFVESFSTAAGFTAENAAANTIQISAINDATNTVTAGANLAANITAGGVLVRYGNRAATSGSGVTANPAVNLECNGMQLLCDDGTIASTFMGVTVANFRRWKGVPIDALSAPISPVFLSQAVIQMRRFSGQVPDTLYAHPCQLHGFVYGNSGTYPDVRFTQASMDQFKVAEPVFNVGGKDLVMKSSIDMPKGKIFLFVKADLLYGELNGVELEEFGDVALFPFQDSTGVKAAQRGWFSWRGNFGTYRRNSFCQIKNVLVPTGF